MSRLLWALPAAAAIALALAARAEAWPDDDFGHLVTPTRSQGLPAGVEPDRPAEPRGMAERPFPGERPRGPQAPVPNPFPMPNNVQPWLICAATYMGPDGVELARQLTLVLRDKHHLTAYIYNRGDEERAAQRKEWEERCRRYPGVRIPFRGYRVTDQYAVLIDGFKDFASATAYLPRVKALPMPELKLASGLSAYDTMQIVEPDHDTKKMISRRANINPFHNAMAVRNPALASGQPNRPKFDPFWKELNSGEKHCLLDNPKKYSLLVKEYAGANVIQSQSSISSFLGAIGLGSKGEALDAAGAQAREIVRFLRTPQLGVEAWVLHTRKASNVYVGGFDGPNDPELARVLRRLASLRFSGKEGQADPIGLYANPPLIEIPRE